MRGRGRRYRPRPWEFKRKGDTLHNQKSKITEDPKGAESNSQQVIARRYSNFIALELDMVSIATCHGSTRIFDVGLIGGQSVVVFQDDEWKDFYDYYCGAKRCERVLFTYKGPYSFAASVFDGNGMELFGLDGMSDLGTSDDDLPCTFLPTIKHNNFESVFDDDVLLTGKLPIPSSFVHWHTLQNKTAASVTYRDTHVMMELEPDGDDIL
ncbi:OLC1v1018674C1 [Oldenlandia corymbosa var. corymbosa]|uniref:OLC1v1018674C1 n=1 Tax=Oldenlandia corymbosa var. corymbosa TaxID=529605 RepID=A0AAV1EC89_OLDCO|nr:OLC1v1018674C1 [Oldenlandia corymbosa var. corymbosa]